MKLMQSKLKIIELRLRRLPRAGSFEVCWMLFIIIPSVSFSDKIIVFLVPGYLFSRQSFFHPMQKFIVEVAIKLFGIFRYPFHRKIPWKSAINNEEKLLNQSIASARRSIKTIGLVIRGEFLIIFCSLEVFHNLCFQWWKSDCKYFIFYQVDSPILSRERIAKLDLKVS